jgi:REP element-mobilizing transposase RayT
MTIFLDDEDYHEFTRRFRRMTEEYAIDCWNYCWMPNHYHAMVRPTLPNISAAIQKLNGGYAQWWNRRHNRVGHVFQGRYKAQIVQDHQYVLAVSRYVVLNPLRAGLAAQPEEWEWSSYAATVGLRAVPSYLSIDSTLSLFGSSDQEALQHKFADFVRAGCNDQSIEDRIRSNEPILGDRFFEASLTNGGQPAQGAQPIIELGV